MKYLKKLQIKLIKGEYKNSIEQQVKEPQQVYEIFKKIKNCAQETLIGVYLCDNLDVRAYDVLSLGSEDKALIDPVQVLRHGILLNSKIFILIHNHPSGKIEPSGEDLKAIKAVMQKALTMEFMFLDFIIVGGNAYWSLFEQINGGNIEYKLGNFETQ